jgi:hypothetical protein
MKWYCVLFSVLIFAGCKKSGSNNEYYVKYIIDGKSSIQQESKTGLKVTLRNEKGISVDYIRSNRGPNEFLVGPVKRGFISSLTGTNACPPLACYIRPNLQIFVSENNGPFVLKKEDASTNLRDVAELSHTIE